MAAISAQCTYLQPEVVSHPSASSQSEKLPLVAAHSHILQSPIDDLGFSWIEFSTISELVTAKKSSSS